MIDLITSTFPFVKELKPINEICRDVKRSEIVWPCPLFALSAYSFSNAMFLALLAEYVCKMDTLRVNINEILKYLSGNAKAKGAEIPREFTKGAFDSIRFLYEHLNLLQIKHPMVDLFFKIINKSLMFEKDSSKPLAFDEIKKKIGVLLRVLGEIVENYDVENTKISTIFLGDLRENSKIFFTSLIEMVELREKISAYIWISRDNFLSELGVPENKDNRQRQLEKKLVEQIIGVAKNDRSAFSSVEVSGWREIFNGFAS